MHKFIETHSCDIIQLFEFDLYNFTEFYPWQISVLKFLIVAIESHPCNSTHPNDQSRLDGQFDLWT
jgi:mRNA deadenylase 3'-5' endonuclease subunit Ccr4